MAAANDKTRFNLFLSSAVLSVSFADLSKTLRFYLHIMPHSSFATSRSTNSANSLCPSLLFTRCPLHETPRFRLVFLYGT